MLKLVVATEPALPVVFWFRVGNVQFAKLPEVGVPKMGVTKVGLVESTLFPEPVDVVTPVPPLATGKVPVTPVVKGRPVALVSVTEVGVPRIGVTSVGLVDNTLLPEPVEVVTPVPPLATAKVPANVIAPEVLEEGVNPVVPALKDVTPAEIAPIWFCTKAVVAIWVVLVPVDAVGASGVPVRVGLADSTTLPVPVDVVTPVPPLATGSVPVTPVVSGKPVAFVSTPEAGVPSAGVVKVGELSVGEVANTIPPEPVTLWPKAV
jgi:hypothetical protein